MTAKRVVARVLCSPPVARLIRALTGGVIASRGMRFDTRSPEVSEGTRAQLFWGLYEAAEVRLARAHLRPSPCLVDLGCSLGVLASVASSRMGPQARFIGVEANESLIRLAALNVTANAPYVRVRVIHGAVDYSHEPGATVSFDREHDHTASALSSGVEHASAFTAPVLRLGDVLDESGVEEYTLLADIEGAEAGLFIKDAASLERCCQMLIEFHSTEFEGARLTPADLLERAVQLGFVVAASYGSVYVLDRQPH